MLGVHTAGSRRVLGGFSARSRQNLGKILARSGSNFASAGDETLWGKTTPREPKGSERMTKSIKREPTASQREPKGRRTGAKRSRKGCHRKPRRGLKRNRSCFCKAFWKEEKEAPSQSEQAFWIQFGSILGAQIGDFSSYFFASFFD